MRRLFTGRVDGAFQRAAALAQLTGAHLVAQRDIAHGVAGHEARIDARRGRRTRR